MGDKVIKACHEERRMMDHHKPHWLGQGGAERKWSDEAAGPLLEIPRNFHQAESRTVMNDTLKGMRSNSACQDSKSQMGFRVGSQPQRLALEGEVVPNG